MTEDKFEKWLNSQESYGGLVKSEVLSKYRAFKAEKPTAPSSLVERLNKWSEGCYGYTDNPSKCPATDEFEKIIREAESKARQYLMGLQDKEAI